VQLLAPWLLYCPAGQTIAVALVDPAGHTYPAVQLPLHSTPPTPGVEAYRPAAHVAQLTAPARLYRPAGHASAVALVDPAGQVYPAVHAPLHSAVPTAAVAPNSPAGQSTHAVAPPKLYRPAGHATAVAFTDPAGQM
jgi:hypothetical protein